MISIVIPNYNKEGRLHACLSSIQWQTYDSFEVLFVDDGSNDASLSIAYSFAAKDTRFKVLARPHLGKVAAINYGIAQASGEWIKIHGSDDEIVETALEKMHSEAEKDVLIHNARLKYDSKVGKRLYSEKSLERVKTSSIENIVPNRISFSSGLYLIRDWIVEKIFPIPHEFPYEDWYILWSLKRLDAEITVLDKNLTYYWQSNGSVWGGIETTNKKTLRFRAHRDYKTIEAFKKYKEPEENIRYARTYIQAILKDSFLQIISRPIGMREKLSVIYHKYPFVRRILNLFVL